MIFGTYRIPKDAVVQAFELGVRRFDTAELYRNQVELGSALKLCMDRFGVPRDQIHVTTKVSFRSLKKKQVVKSVETSLRQLDIGYVDCVLLHCPENCVDNWIDLAVMQRKHPDLIRSIGVSNFNTEQIDRLSEIKRPVCNQIELSPLVFRQKLVADCVERGVEIVAHSVFCNGRVFTDPEIQKAAERRGVDVATLVINWIHGMGLQVATSSLSRDHMIQNLKKVEMEESTLDKRFDEKFVCYPKFI